MLRPVKLMAIASIAGVAAVLAPTPASAADKDSVYTDLFSNLAIEGFDTIALFNGEQVKGSKSFETTYNGAKWRFSSAENLATFQAEPAKYAPQYGGYCAWAAAQGYTAKGDPDYATVYEGKLYLNFNMDVQSRWEKDIPGFIEQADANWSGILTK